MPDPVRAGDLLRLRPDSGVRRDPGAGCPSLPTGRPWAGVANVSCCCGAAEAEAAATPASGGALPAPVMGDANVARGADPECTAPLLPGAANDCAGAAGAPDLDPDNTAPAAGGDADAAPDDGGGGGARRGLADLGGGGGGGGTSSSSAATWRPTSASTRCDSNVRLRIWFSSFSHCKGEEGMRKREREKQDDEQARGTNNT